MIITGYKATNPRYFQGFRSLFKGIFQSLRRGPPAFDPGQARCVQLDTRMGHLCLKSLTVTRRYQSVTGTTTGSLPQNETLMYHPFPGQARTIAVILYTEG